MIEKQRLFVRTALLLATLAISACTPLITASEMAEDATPVAEAAEVTTESAEPASEAATATVNVRSLRVRAEPVESGEVVAGLREGEIYSVLGISSDGLWVQLAIEGITGGSGWVSANFVTMSGPITDAVTTAVPEAPAVADTTTQTNTVTTVTTDTIALAPTSVPSIAATPAPGFTLISSGETRLRVRGEPSAEAPIVGYVYDGESYETLEISADGQWVRIGGSTGTNADNPNGGWVAAQFVAIGQ